MDKFFRLKERGTTVGTELLAGLTTFLTIAYIFIVNPAILADAGMNFDGVFMATILTTALATLIMALFSNYPIVIGPGMGLNAYFTYTIVLTQGFTWQAALGAVFVTGVLFVIISLTPLRAMLIDAIPASLKYAITAGIGLFIAFIGLQSTKIVVDSPSSLVAVGNFRDPVTLLSMIGLILSVVLLVFRVRGSLFIGMIITSIIAYAMGMMDLPGSLFAWPQGFETTAFQLDITGVFEHGLYAIVFTYLLVILFETTGSLLGLAEQAGLMKGEHFPRSRGAYLADALGTTVGSVLGTSPTTAYMESGAGIAVGGRTGLTGVFAAGLILLTMFFAPVANMLSAIPAVTTPPLIIVGFLMMEGLKHLNWSDMEEAFPVFLILLLIPLTYSISTGIGVGFIVYVLIKILRGKARQVHPILYLFSLLFLVQIALA
ncbi:guanine permease [Paenibacillus swuensis]|uniref:Guanine permease n=1 Tax=Paenibacillus swuensis TaxID=1178515 RepID=A0A172TPL6_9BACL|nr:NCS2 family permease [Paenibacillus swuensis]ANE48757.1 guanine permease [Paenibacillus swuensis]